MTTIINKTPHTISIVNATGETITVPATAPAARVTVTNVVMPAVAGISVNRQSFGEIENLPAPEEDTIFIVSALVGGRVSGRSDVFGPDTGPTAIRNEAGQIVAVRGLVQFG